MLFSRCYVGAPRGGRIWLKTFDRVVVSDRIVLCGVRVPPYIGWSRLRVSDGTKKLVLLKRLLPEMATPIPEFVSPPVSEVVLGVQFEKMESLKTPQLGYLWHAFRDRFPHTEEQPPLEPVIEQFGQRLARRPSVRLQFLATPPRPRLWLLNDAGTELVQIQDDRFVRNWRKQEDSDEYPRYRRLRELFKRDFGQFLGLVAANEEVVEPNQCEVTYVNIIPSGKSRDDHGDLEKVVTVFSAGCPGGFPGKLEEAGITLRFILAEESGEPVGRLHVVAKPVFRVSDDQPAIELTLTARGRPEGEGIEGVMNFLDRGHEAVVRCFASITTPEMHHAWVRVQ